MKTESFIGIYEEFFHRAGKVPKRIKTGDDPIIMDPLQAIGTVDNLEMMVQRVKQMGHGNLAEKATAYFDNSFINKAFFYYVMAGLKKGHSLDEILRKAFDDFFISPDLPYMIHKLDWSDSLNPTTIFLDWDGTVEVNGSLRDNTIEFLQYFSDKNKSLGVHRYFVIVASASFELMGKVDRHSDKLLRLIDGIYSIPVIARPSDQGNKLVMGKLYTDICKRLGIWHERAIVLTDLWGDRSVENSYPIITCVTPAHLSAEAWIQAINHLETLGDGNFFNGAQRVRRDPYDFSRDPKNDAAEDWRLYTIGKHFYLWRTKRLENCFFLANDDVKPPVVSEKII